MIRRTAILAAILTAMVTITSCTPPTEPAPSAAVPQDGTLRVGLVLEPSNLDIRRQDGAALQQILIDNVYQGLVRRTQDNTIEPSLASEYTVSEDGLTYTFVLREGVTFHNEKALTSDDVVTTYKQVQSDPKLSGNADFAPVATIESPDPKTVVITLSEPSQDFLFALTGVAGLVYAKDDKTDMKTSANGTGPFVVDSWRKGDSIVLKKNESYWGTPAKINEVSFSYIPDLTAGVNAALSGDLDVLTAVEPTLVSRFEGTDFKITYGKTTDRGILAFNSAKEPLSDPRVREALRRAVNKGDMVTALGAGVTQFGPIPELDPGYEDLSRTAPEYDPARARELLAEAGVTDLKLTLTIPNFYSTTVAQVLVSAYNEIGVTLTVNRVEFTAWLDSVFEKKDYELSFVLHVEPRDLGIFANPNYYFNYTNPKVIELYQQALVQTDPAKYEQLLSEAAKLIAADSPVDWLYTAEAVTAVRPYVTGFPVNSINARINLADVALTG